MAKRGVEEQIGELNRLRDIPVTDQSLSALRKGLQNRVNLIIAKAARIAGDLRLKPLIPDMVATFDRLLVGGGEADPQCWGKDAIAKALTELDFDESESFLRGYRHVQMESAWGGKTDTAVTLRSLCTLALVQCADLPRADKLRHLVTAVSDLEESVRIDALRALEQMEGEDVALLLRLKAGVGDRRATVVGQALESLLRIEGTRGLEFVRGFLKERVWANPREFGSTGEEFVEEAALAMGTSRLPEAVGTLKAAWEREPKTVFLQAISVARLESGFEFLLTLVKSGRERDAAAALEVLSLHRDSPELKAAIHLAVEARGGAEIQRTFLAKFGDSQ